MRVVTPKKLKEFSLNNTQARIPLLNWYEIVKKAKQDKFSDVKQDFRTVDYVGNNRYVFNVKGNDYRVIVIIIFISKKVYIRYIGNHTDYHKIDAKTI